MISWGLSLATIILGTMCRAASHKNKNKTLPHGQLLTLVFHYFGVDVTGEEARLASTVTNRSLTNQITYYYSIATT